MPCLTTHFLEVTALVSLKVATICYFRGTKPSKITFKAIFKAKPEKCDQSDLCFSHTFEIFIPCLTISFGNGSMVLLQLEKTKKRGILRLLI